MSSDFSEVNRLAVDIGKVGAGAQKFASQAVGKTLIDIVADGKQIATEKDVKDSGDLINSITTDFRTGKLSGEAGPTVNYGLYQELGTSTQPGRPYMGPAFDRRAPGLETALSQIADGIVD